uniref:Nucleolar protein 10 n=1 Tax=Castor canadensis TaxID=51338 RepID=A0A8C0X0N2_CASCN
TFPQYSWPGSGDWIYTLKKFDPMGQQTCSAHLAGLSPDDKYSRYCITVNKPFSVFSFVLWCWGWNPELYTC